MRDLDQSRGRPCGGSGAGKVSVSGVWFCDESVLAAGVDVLDALRAIIIIWSSHFGSSTSRNYHHMLKPCWFKYLTQFWQRLSLNRKQLSVYVLDAVSYNLQYI